MIKISKTFDFEYSHRVYTQNINSNLACSNGSENTCQHWHGHSGSLKVELGSNTLDNRGFVLDYKELGFIKDIIKDYLDHKSIIGVGDPLFGYFKETMSLELVEAFFSENLTHKIYIVESTQDNLIEAVRSFIESFTIVDVIPTSENLAFVFYHLIYERMKALSIPDDIKLLSVSWSETPTSTATYDASCKYI
jgi:6-pyruvoyl-tetrahydropterin synthase